MIKNLEVALRQNFVLEDFPLVSQELIHKSGRVWGLLAGEMLFPEGDKAGSLFLIESGLLDIGVTVANGKRLTLNIVGAGSVVGEVGMLDGEGRTAEAVVLSDCQIRQFTKAEIFACFDTPEKASDFFIQQLCKRIRWINEQSEHGRLLPAASVLASRLMMLNSGREGEWISASQELLAGQAGLTREYVNHILVDWKRQGAVDLRRGGFRVLQLGFLQMQ